MKLFSRSLQRSAFVRIVISVFILLMLEQAVAAVSVRVSSTSFVTLMPGNDLFRQNIANVSVTTDQAYSISLNDEHGGVMVNGAYALPYRVSYNNGSEIRLSRNPVVVETSVSPVSANRTIAVTIAGANSAIAMAGDYSTTLMVTITAF